MVTTDRLALVRVERAHKEALARGASELAASLHAGVPAGWPQFPHAFALPAAGVPDGPPSAPFWGGFFFIHMADRMIAGNGGFKGPPDEWGTVDIGYEIAPAYRNVGLATEAAGALIALAFTHQQVRAVSADTLDRRNASNSVLRKLGMTFAGERDHPTAGKVWRWTLRRHDTRPARR